jgi:hypothetical protein
MTDSRNIAVVGAPGTEGGGLVRAILADPASGLRARAIMRKANGDKALELRKLRGEVVVADLENEEGAYGASCVTNYREHRTREDRQGAMEAEEEYGAPFVMDVPDVFTHALVMEQPNTFSPDAKSAADCGHSCHVAVKSKGYIFHPYQQR